MKNEGPLWVFCDGSTDIVPVDIRPGGKNNSKVDKRPPRLFERWRKYFQTGNHCGASAIARGPTGQILDWRWQRLPAVSNNEAEYAGLILGLNMAQLLKANETICVLDSEIVVGQMAGRFAVKSRGLRRWHWQACAAARELPSVRYYVVPREWNRLADGLAGQALIPWRSLQPAIEQFNAEER